MQDELKYQGVSAKEMTYVNMINDPYEASKEEHALVIMTEREEFKTLDYNRIYDQMLKPAFVFDGRNLLDHEMLWNIGFTVHGIGKSKTIPYMRLVTTTSLDNV